MKRTLLETTESFKWVYKKSICQILNEPNAALATSNFTFSWTARTGPNPAPFAMYKNSDANRDLNSTFFLESLRKMGSSLENNQYGKIAPFGETEPQKGIGKRSTMVFWTCGHNLYHARILLHRSFELAGEMSWLVALKMDPWGGGIFELGRVHFRPLLLFVFNTNRGRKWTLPSSKMPPLTGPFLGPRAKPCHLPIQTSDAKAPNVLPHHVTCSKTMEASDSGLLSDATEPAVWCDFSK